MGLGPNGERLGPRIGVSGLPLDMDTWTRDKQIERSLARAASQSKRRADGAPKVRLPKPRKHKHHCFCLPRKPEESITGLAQTQSSLLCCRCKGDKCMKPKKRRSTKSTTSSVVESVNSVDGALKV